MTLAQLTQLLGGIGVIASLIYVAMGLTMGLISGGHALGRAVGAEM
jgi:hypothetical protein